MTARHRPDSAEHRASPATAAAPGTAAARVASLDRSSIMPARPNPSRPGRGRKPSRKPPSPREVLDGCVARVAAEASRRGIARPTKAREVAERWLASYAFGIAAGRAEAAVFASERRTGRAEGLREAFSAVVEAYHPDAAMRAREAGLFSMDEPLLLRCIRDAPRVSTLELARLLVPGVGPLRLEAGVLSSL